MVISYLGKQTFKITQGDLTIAINPPSKDSAFSVSRFGSDIVLSTTNHPDYNGVDQMSYGEREPFIINSPGEYEVKGMFFHGAPMDIVLTTGKEDKKYISTIYQFDVDGMSVVFLGPIGNAIIPVKTREIIGSPDILFIPIGGGNMIDSKIATKLAVSLDAKIIIPMDYGNDGEKNSLENFSKEFGKDSIEKLEKLTIKRKDLDTKNGHVVVLSV